MKYITIGVESLIEKESIRNINIDGNVINLWFKDGAGEKFIYNSRAGAIKEYKRIEKELLKTK